MSEMALGEQEKQEIRTLIHEEIEAARTRGALLSDEEHRFLREWVETTRKRQEFLSDVLKKTIVFAVLGALGTVGLAIWEYVKAKINSP